MKQEVDRSPEAHGQLMAYVVTKRHHGKQGGKVRAHQH